MLSLFFIWQLLFFTVFSVKDISQADLNRQTQDFESVFAIQNYPNEFLTGWFGNEIRATSSRIYPANGLGRNGSKALAVQPISTFDGEIVIRLAPGQFTDPQVKFWARSVKNGSGDRSALVSYRWGEQLDGDYSVRETLGEPDEFENEDQEFRLFAIELPKGLQEAGEVYLKLEIRYGPGIGSCAKWLMDDFEFGEFVEDTAAPKIKNVRGFDEREIEIQFDEELDPVFSEFILNYKLDGIEPLEAKRKSDSLVYLTFEVKLENGRNYQLEVLQIPDLEGNFLQDSLLNFQFFDPTFIPHKTLVINELMPAPKADLDLPNVEYVEIFHAGEYPIRLSGVSYANSRNRVVLGSEWVQPGEFLIFCSENQASLLRDYGRVIPVRNWPTLLNSGDQVSLRDDQGKLIDVISYTTGSWAGSDFASGGYSLEVPNPFYPCDQSSLLKASVDLLRGTPGRENSVLSLAPDVSLLSLISAEFLTEKSLLLTFSKPVLVGLDQSNFGFDPNLSIDSLFVVKSNQIQIFLENEVSPNTIYTLQINGVFDCFGNQFVQDEVIRLVLPLQAQIGEVWINELLFNPKTGSPKFIELVNVSDSYVEVKDWMLANKDEFGEVDQLKQLSETSVIIPPKGFLAITTNTDQLKLDFPKSSFGQFTKIKALPSYPIAGQTVVLLNSVGELADSFTYSEELHHPLLRDPKGVSLERLSTESPASSPANWHSASAVEGYGTPGRKNSQVISGEFEGDLILIEPEVFDPEGSNGNTFTAIRYELDQPGWVGSFRIYSTTGQMVQVLAQHELLGASGLFTWTGTDSQGKLVRPGYYVLMVELYDLSGQVMVIRKTIVVATRL